MAKKTELPKVKSKKINLKELAVLAKKVRESLKEEEEYLRKHADNHSPRFYLED